MKKKTSNFEHRTSNIEGSASPSDVVLIQLRVEESVTSPYGLKRNRKFDLEDRLLDFAVEIIEFTDGLPNTRAANHLASQLLRAGTSPYGNHGEAESAESIKDFVHKLKICLKELRETRRWLRLAGLLKNLARLGNLEGCLNEADELIRIFVASIRTAEKNMK